MADGDGLSKYTSHLSHINRGAAGAAGAAQPTPTRTVDPSRLGSVLAVGREFLFFYLLPSPINKELKRKKEAG